MDVTRNEPRAALNAIFRAALQAVNGRACVTRALQADPIVHSPVALVAVGKAASAMLLGALDVISDAVVCDALLVTKHGHVDSELRERAHVTIIEAGHPLPDQHSVDAGVRLMSMLHALPRDAFVLFLLSGGASSLVECLPDGITLSDARRVNEWLLASGLPITQMNRIRMRLSRIKGGQLRSALNGRAARVLLLSDVPSDDVRVIGSGPLAQPEPTASLPIVPSWLQHLLERAAASRPSRPAAVLGNIPHQIIADVRQCKHAAAAAARALGFAVHVDEHVMQGDAATVGRDLAHQLCTGAPGVYIWGGETTVLLPAQPGRGGRNQTLALAAAEVMRGRSDVMLLAAGTDGTDGPGEIAGAIVDGGTVSRGQAAGWLCADALARADAGTFLAVSGDLLRTGPTGTNVMDLIVGVRFRSNETGDPFA